MGKSKKQAENGFLKAFKKANREIAFERNGGGHFVASTKVFKNKKKYDRKREKRINFDSPYSFFNNPMTLMPLLPLKANHVLVKYISLPQPLLMKGGVIDI